MPDLRSQATELIDIIRQGHADKIQLRRVIEDGETVSNRAALTRLAIKLLRRVNASDIANSFQVDLGRLYVEWASATADPAAQLLVLGWATVLCPDANLGASLYDAERAWFESLPPCVDRHLLLNAAAADVGIEVDWGGREVRLIAPSGASRIVPLSSVSSHPAANLVFTGGKARAATLNSWIETAGMTDAGGKPTNADVLAVSWDGSFGEPRWLAAAVFDGAGFARDALAAARFGAEAFLLGIALAADVSVALAVAASAIRITNRRLGFDGHATVGAAFVTQTLTEVCVVGDAYAAAPQPNEFWKYPISSLNDQAIVGGQPLGQTMTTSGRPVGTLLVAPEPVVLKPTRSHRLVLGSDGLSAGGLANVERALSTVDEPAAACEAAINICLETFARGFGSRDNISALVIERRLEGG